MWTIRVALATAVLFCWACSDGRAQYQQPRPAGTGVVPVPVVQMLAGLPANAAASAKAALQGGAGTSQQQQQAQQQQPCDRTRRVFTEAFGEISDGPAGSNYTQDSHCEWLIKARNDSQFITLTFRSMGTECSYDYVFVYDGDSFKSPLLGSFSGKTEPQKVIATSGSMLILLYSDTNYVLEGFKAEFRVSNCPNNCSGQGKCVGHQCVCHGDWIGTDCSLHACPDACGLAEGRGQCLKEHCRCNAGYAGKSCSLHAQPAEGNEWHWLSTFQGGLSPRAAHTAVYVPQTDSLYVFGGYDLNNVLGSLQIYSFNKSTWEDEWGISLRSRHFPNEIDNALIKAVLHHNDDDEARRWGLTNDASFFRNILLSLTEQSFLARTQRSTPLHAHDANVTEAAAAAVDTPHDLQEFLEEFTDKPRPADRYGHAVAAVQDGFVIYGGKLGTDEGKGREEQQGDDDEVPLSGGSGGLSDELWMFNVTQNEGSGQWERRATNSTVQPPALTRHTLTCVDGVLYVFGGSLRSGEFSSKIFRLRLASPATEQWHELRPRGGKALDVRVVAHTTIHHRASNSLIVYGGVVAGIARFSKLSDRMFAFQLDQRHWTEIQYPRTPLRDAYIPRERAFHTATVAGNYMLVFGGYTHRHNKDEICYDNQMYLYHLGCHTWINQDVLGSPTATSTSTSSASATTSAGTGTTGEASRYPKQQGVFAHAATVRNGNTLLIVGGYHGNVNADLLAYTLPAMLVVPANESLFNPEALCVQHTGVSECLADPECGWCSADNVCYGRTVGANCTTNLQTTRCPGVCPALGDCHACLIHGMSAAEGGQTTTTVASKFGLNQCTWCVQNARCHHRDDNYGVCGEDTPSAEPGWWGAQGTEVRDAMQCTRLDRRPGLTFLKYLAPVNWTQPDDVSIVNATMVDFVATPGSTHMEQHQGVNASVVARLVGFIRPTAAWRLQQQQVVESGARSGGGEQMQACASYAFATLRLGGGEDAEGAEMGSVLTNISAEQTRCVHVDWPAGDRDRFAVDFQARRIWDTNTGSHHQHSKIGLQHIAAASGHLALQQQQQPAAHAFTFEYLEPFRNGSCQQYANCAYCVADAACGWCELTNRCADRDADERSSCSLGDSPGDDWQYLVIQPSRCANCSNYIACDSCVDSGLCEWWVEDARCARIGRAPTAVRSAPACPAPCAERRNCSACLEERGRCVWCAATSQCFSFSVYTSEFQFGLCREWLDQSVPFGAAQPQQQTPADQVAAEQPGAITTQPVLKPAQQQCKSCAAHANCSVCLRSLSCGWCFDRDNPIEGLCLEGDFNRSRPDCAAALNATAPNEYAEWAYAQCPDVDECGLGLHDCHREAKCTNTHGSYNCHCRRGFVGDGRTTCVRTCYEQCQNGWCSGAPDFVCRCQLGWTGADCSQSCGCNNHSRCTQRIGLCDECENWTEGERCERCRPGSYGNATAPEGCRPCDCNGHGDAERGVCDGQTGECYCRDNAEGERCEKCARNYYGDPRGGGQCYFHCESRGMLTAAAGGAAGGRQGIGSWRSHRLLHWAAEASECLWIVSPHTRNGSLLGEGALIQFEVRERDLNVRCGENAVYVYDGLPDLIGHTQQNQLLAVFCGRDTNPQVVEARSGHLTVHYKQGAEGQGFNATYVVQSCADGTCRAPYVCGGGGQQCVCPAGWTGVGCTVAVCPAGCSEALGQGQCDRAYGRCVCAAEWSGADCSVRPLPEQAVVTELFNAHRLSAEFEHLRKTLPRFGHSLVADRRGSLWMFGGYSLSHGPLNDIRQFDTKNNTWTQVTVESTAEAKMPDGRYFHAADIQHSRQAVFVYGGLTAGGRVLGDFWQFVLTQQRWEEVAVNERGSTKLPPRLAGMTMTLIRDGDGNERLVMVGGFSPLLGMNGKVYEYDLRSRRWQVLMTGGAGPVGIFGHTAAFHQTAQTLYVFGGCEFRYGHETRVSNRLFAFDYAARRWSVLAPFRNDDSPVGRFLHTAVITERYMLVMGGRTEEKAVAAASVPGGKSDGGSGDVLAAYLFDCNQWTRLDSDAIWAGSATTEGGSSRLPHSTYAQAMVLAEQDGAAAAANGDLQTDTMFVVGGWAGSSTQSLVTRLRLPADLCELWGTGKYQCRRVIGCTWCAVPRILGGATIMPNATHGGRCVAFDRSSEVCEYGLPNAQPTAAEQRVATPTGQFQRGTGCNAAWYRSRNCTAFTSCGSCLAAWQPASPDWATVCKWCEKCGHGRCVRVDDGDCAQLMAGEGCERGRQNGKGHQLALGSRAGQQQQQQQQQLAPSAAASSPPSATSTAVTLTTTESGQCADWGAECLASDCESCHRMRGCGWVEYHGRPMCGSVEFAVTHSLNQTACRDRCDHQQSCVGCLRTHSLEGGWAECRWSTQLERCISPSYQPMFCAGEVCGLVLGPRQEERCPQPCGAYEQCAECLRHAHCGWCSRTGGGGGNGTTTTMSGDGVCTEGSLESPAEHPAASTCDIIYASVRNGTATEVGPDEEFRWNYVRCPAENECENGHHRCEARSQRCVDAEVGYSCECGEGYQMDAVRERCVPVCRQGCVRGHCVEPDRCSCDFGYVGANCSIQCQCNGHSNCAGPDRLDECLSCTNNTIGAQCDRCQPLFVGDPRDNGDCVPCDRYCHGHTDVCVPRDSVTAYASLSRAQLAHIMPEGPRDSAVCLRCSNRTAAERCETCVHGHFRGVEDLRAACFPCQCHGHGDTCDPVTGEKCNCGNNTESDATCSASTSRNSAQQCWQVQCSKCRDSYAGNPTDGHQCYKSITVESKMCFDAKTIDECKKPAPLRPGQTVFFAVQPRFMNVDIRIIIDVTQGELDLYMSPQDDSFVVQTNTTTGEQTVLLDGRYRWERAPDSEPGDRRPIEVSSAATATMQFNADSDAASADADPDGTLPWTAGMMTMMAATSSGNEPPAVLDCHTASPHGFSVYDRRAGPLSTYVTLRHCNTLLRVYGLRNRLVLTLPQSAHNLSSTRFYLALRAASQPGGPAASYGLVFFRQDQLHIDLFVFFSVFFSCFFLFLAVCVVAWKTKQAHDVRRARQRHVVEMMHMAKRPFSRVTLVIGGDGDGVPVVVAPAATPANVRRRGGAGQQQTSAAAGQAGRTSTSKRDVVTAHPLQLAPSTSNQSDAAAAAATTCQAAVRPVAVEPTADGVAAVASVFVSLPGKSRGPVSLALGSTLTLASRQLIAATAAHVNGPMVRYRGGQGHAGQQQTGSGGGGSAVVMGV